MKRIFLMIFLLAHSITVSAADRPNILFIHMEDMGVQIPAYGDHTVATPNLDKLVERGTTFTHAYNMGSWSGAVCVASRHMLNTGAFVWNAERLSQGLGSGGKKGKQAPKVDSGIPDFQKEGLMWSQLMSQSGYRTYFTGARGVEYLGSHWTYLDLAPFGRQETWEDSPEGWPQTAPYD